MCLKDAAGRVEYDAPLRVPSGEVRPPVGRLDGRVHRHDPRPGTPQLKSRARCDMRGP
jgi:hypothetical protein